ncbi:atherin-like [Theropithecus gelada]|uniref:atherin-like n=1 Tax=Theropithecus gelada TaxID=9565 RepID=UPI000DC197C7|nr:atherin-like [Theropithecus gelada]
MALQEPHMAAPPAALGPGAQSLGQGQTGRRSPPCSCGPTRPGPEGARAAPLGAGSAPVRQLRTPPAGCRRCPAGQPAACPSPTTPPHPASARAATTQASVAPALRNETCGPQAAERQGRGLRQTEGAHCSTRQGAGLRARRSPSRSQAA